LAPTLHSNEHQEKRRQNHESHTRHAVRVLAFALLSTTAKAIPVTYSYVGSFYDEIQAEGPGATAQDRMTISFTLDSSFWGLSLQQTGSFRPFTDRLIASGPWQMDGFDTARLTTDANGAVISWNMFCAVSGLDILSYGHEDGSGRDIIDLAGGLSPSGSARANYAAGPRGNWSMAIGGEPVESVPDPGNSLGLLVLALVGLWLPRPRATSGGTV
jgi:hypothetical protein